MDFNFDLNFNCYRDFGFGIWDLGVGFAASLLMFNHKEHGEATENTKNFVGFRIFP